MLQGLGALEAVGLAWLGRLGWLWGASGLRGTGSKGAWGVGWLGCLGVARVARGLIILWFS